MTQLVNHHETSNKSNDVIHSLVYLSKETKPKNQQCFPYVPHERPLILLNSTKASACNAIFSPFDFLKLLLISNYIPKFFARPVQVDESWTQEWMFQQRGGKEEVGGAQVKTERGEDRRQRKRGGDSVHNQTYRMAVELGRRPQLFMTVSSYCYERK